MGYTEQLAKAEEVKAKLIPLLNNEQVTELDRLLELTALHHIEDSVSAYESGFKLGVNIGFESGKLTDN